MSFLEKTQSSVGLILGISSIASFIVLVVCTCLVFSINQNLLVNNNLPNKGSDIFEPISSIVSCKDLQIAYDDANDNNVDNEEYAMIECELEYKQTFFSSVDLRYQTVGVDIGVYRNGVRGPGAGVAFYRIDNGPWQYAFGRQNTTYCSSFESEDMRVAFADWSCIDSSDQLITVKQYYNL